MIYWLLLIFCVILSLFAKVVYDKNEGLSFAAFGVAVCMGLAFVVSSIYMATEYVGLDGRIEYYRQRYESLVYQAENHLYDDDINVSKKALADQIMNWNADLVRRKKNQHDFWIGIFVPDIYDQFDFIPIESIGG